MDERLTEKEADGVFWLWAKTYRLSESAEFCGCRKWRVCQTSSSQFRCMFTNLVCIWQSQTLD